MAQHQHTSPAPIGGSLINAATLVCGVLIAIMAAILLVRFVFGLGAVTNVNDGYSWGIWVVVDVMIGSALACGGFSVALLVYIFNKGEYHPLIRPALLASLFGYTLAGGGIFFDLGRWWNFWHIFNKGEYHPLIRPALLASLFGYTLAGGGIFFDLGRWWNFWHIFWPSYANPNSVMFEVAVCVTAYIVVMWIEFSPVFLEKLGLVDVKKKLTKVLFFFIALGMVLPMMHQASLGTMLVVMGGQVNPLWQTPAVPLIYLLSAIILGYGVVLFESCVAASSYRRKIEMHLLNPMSKIMLGVLAVYLIVRLGDLLARGALGEAFKPNLQAIAFWLENLCFVAPFFLIGSVESRRNPARLFLAGIAIMLGGILLRLNGFLIGYGHHTGSGWTYFPSFAEVMVTTGMFAIEVLGYIIITRRFPVLPRENAQVAN